VQNTSAFARSTGIANVLIQEALKAKAPNAVVLSTGLAAADPKAPAGTAAIAASSTAASGQGAPAAVAGADAAAREKAPAYGVDPKSLLAAPPVSSTSSVTSTDATSTEPPAKEPTAQSCTGDDISTATSTDVSYGQAIVQLLQANMFMSPDQMVQDLNSQYGIKATLGTSDDGRPEVVLPDGTTFVDGNGNGVLDAGDEQFNQVTASVADTSGTLFANFAVNPNADVNNSVKKVNQSFNDASKQSGQNFPKDHIANIFAAANQYVS
jgi:hypothetical protein